MRPNNDNPKLIIPLVCYVFNILLPPSIEGWSLYEGCHDLAERSGHTISLILEGVQYNGYMYCKFQLQQ